MLNLTLLKSCLNRPSKEEWVPANLELKQIPSGNQTWLLKSLEYMFFIDIFFNYVSIYRGCPIAMFDYRRVPVYLYVLKTTHISGFHKMGHPQAHFLGFNMFQWSDLDENWGYPHDKTIRAPCHSLTPLKVLAKLLSSTLYLFSAFTTTSTENQVDAKICQSPDGKSGNSSTSPRNHY